MVATNFFLLYAFSLFSSVLHIHWTNWAFSLSRVPLQFLLKILLSRHPRPPRPPPRYFLIYLSFFQSFSPSFFFVLSFFSRSLCVFPILSSRSLSLSYPLCIFHLIIVFPSLSLCLSNSFCLFSISLFLYFIFSLYFIKVFLSRLLSFTNLLCLF